MLLWEATGGSQPFVRAAPRARHRIAPCRRELFMAKKITGYLKLQVPAGSANPSPPIGPALGQRGLNIMEVCKTFNAQTQNMEQGMPVPVVITAYADRTVAFITETPPVRYFLKKAASVEKGSKTPGKDEKVGSVTMAQVREIAAKK